VADAALNHFDFRIPDIPICPVCFHPLCHGLQGLSQGYGIGTDHCAGNDRFCPLVLQIHFGDRDIEFTVQARYERLDPSALFFERGAKREVKVESECGEQGDLRLTIFDFGLEKE